MNNHISDDLLLALLSLDAYSRGKVDTVALQDLSQKLGSAEVQSNSDDPGYLEPLGKGLGESKPADVGFSATSYLVKDGFDAEGNQQYRMVIAYRGTDFRPDNWTETIKDVLAGWLSSFNLLGENVKAPGGVAKLPLQPEFAEAFFKKVAGTDDVSGAYPDITLTGHSLGGSLAGFVGSRVETRTVFW